MCVCIMYARIHVLACMYVRVWIGWPIIDGWEVKEAVKQRKLEMQVMQQREMTRYQD